jgi:hypothetical protein
MALDAAVSSYVYSIPVRKTLDLTAAATGLYNYWQTKDWMFAEVAILAALDLAGNTYDVIPERFAKLRTWTRDYLQNTGLLLLGFGVAKLCDIPIDDYRGAMDYFALGSMLTALSTDRQERWNFQPGTELQKP